MRVEHYSKRYQSDVFNLVKSFHKEYLLDVFGETDAASINQTIDLFSGDGSKNAFLLIAEDGEDKCVGILAGVEAKSKLNDQRMFQEILWYVEKPYGRYGFHLINQAKIVLKSYGFSHIIMAVLESPKTMRIKKIYERLGFKPLETHYVRNL